MTGKLFAMAALAGLSAIGAPALAQDAADWSGFYVGGSVGYSEQASNDGETLLFDTNRDVTFDDTVRTGAGANAFSPGFCSGAAIGNAPAAGCRTTDGNINLALRAGYDWQFGNWVVGGVAEASKVRIGDDASGFSTTPASYTFTRDLDYVLAARARAGYAFDRYLVYGTAGFAWGELDHSFTTTNTANSFTPSGDGDNAGYQVGAGFEMMLGESMSVGVEYLRTSLDDDEYTVDIGPGTAPPTNPFRLVNTAGTFTKRSEDKFEYDTFSVTAAWRY